MKRLSSIPAFLWYAPAITGICYLVVFIFFVVVSGNPAYRLAGDMAFTIAQVCVMLTMFLLHKSNMNGRGFWKKFSLFIPALGALSYICGFLSGVFGELIILFYPLGALLSGLGMLIVGIQVARAGVLKEWKRFTPLLVGLYPFLIMFPIVLVTGSPSIVAILLWGLPWNIMGVAMLNEFYGLKKAVG